LATDKPHLVYFYCHGGVTEREGKQMPYLSVGAPTEDLIIRSTLRASSVRWDDPRPLVFINGCHTTALDATAALDFVTGFVQQAQACGVIGTEITVFEQLACDFATKFWTLFLQGQEIGRAIQRTRLDLLQAGNPLGLVYTPFVLAGTKLEKIA
jgi:CHAT domain